jgi:outer membrane biosynthesis protein TonB
MIKYIILLFNLMGLFLYQMFFQTSVTATQTVPANADAGSSFVVQVTINKADVSGFAKYQEDLPPGFTATAIAKQGATVLSSDNAIKFIWAALPSDQSITISFKVTVDPSVSGNQSLSGKFLYVVNNERQESDVPASSITVNKPVVAQAAPPAAVAPAAPPQDTTKQAPIVAATPTVAPTPVTPPAPAPVATTPPPSNPAPVATTPTPAPVIATPVATPVPSAPVVINITRSFSAANVTPTTDMLVSLTIHKGNLSGFAKLEESLPSDLVAASADNQGASFTFVDNKAKFVWLSLPSDSVFTVSYKISVTSTASGSQPVSGEFSYLVDNNAAKYEVASTSFMVQAAPQPVATTMPVPVPAPSVDTTKQAPVVASTPTVAPAPVTPPVVTQPAPQPVVAETQPAPAPVPSTNQTASSSTNMTSAITPHISGTTQGVKYRVQIMALHNPVKSSYLAKKFNITETINQEMLEGYTKYTVGRFNEYKAVHDHREELRGKGVEGPFVVAYNGGKRITVQEALMITHQQWYK